MDSNNFVCVGNDEWFDFQKNGPGEACEEVGLGKMAEVLDDFIMMDRPEFGFLGVDDMCDLFHLAFGNLWDYNKPPGIKEFVYVDPEGKDIGRGINVRGVGDVKPHVVPGRPIFLLFWYEMSHLNKARVFGNATASLIIRGDYSRPPEFRDTAMRECPIPKAGHNRGSVKPWGN